MTASKGDDFVVDVQACRFCKSSIDEECIVKLQGLLPAGVKYLIDSCIDTGSGLEVIIHANICTEEQTLDWLKEYEDSSMITLRVSRTYPDIGNRILFKKMYHCHHKNRGEKSTNCQAEATLTLRRTQFVRKKGNGATLNRPCRSKDPHLPEYPLMIIFRGGHNHTLKPSGDVDESVRQKFERLFKAGYSPSAAYFIHQNDLNNKYNSRYDLVREDRRLSPDKSWLYRFYYKIKKTLECNTEKMQIEATAAKEVLREVPIETMFGEEDLAEVQIETTVAEEELPEVQTETMVARKDLQEVQIETMVARKDLQEVQIETMVSREDLQVAEEDLLEQTADDFLVHDLKAAFNTIEGFYKSDPIAHDAAIRSFCLRVKTSNKRVLQSSLHNFGKSSNAPRSMLKKKVQSTALAKRRVLVGSCKQSYLDCSHESPFTAEHDSAVKRLSESGHCQLFLKPHAMHNLQLKIKGIEVLR